MEYKNIQKAVFLSRPNRFIAHVEIDGNIEKCHVKNTGRLKELLLPNATVYVEPNDNPNRKTKFSLIIWREWVLSQQQKPNRSVKIISDETNTVD